MILTIDVGNTNIKVAVFKQVNLVEKFVFQKEELKNNFKNILKKYSNCTNAVLSSVGKLEEFEVLWLKSQLNILEITHISIFPFKNSYGSPKTLGIDRMVLAAGAVLLYPNQNTLIIDAGTCVTYDYVDKNNIYHGGAISPGIALRYKAMHDYTAKLPLLSIKAPEKLIGNSNDTGINQ